jgi:hypothetical protein
VRIEVQEDQPQRGNGQEKSEYEGTATAESRADGDHYSSRKRGVEEANCIIKQRFRKYTDQTPVLCGTGRKASPRPRRQTIPPLSNNVRNNQLATGSAKRRGGTAIGSIGSSHDLSCSARSQNPWNAPKPL